MTDPKAPAVWTSKAKEALETPGRLSYSLSTQLTIPGVLAAARKGKS